jgi:hypothetical protein
MGRPEGKKVGISRFGSGTDTVIRLLFRKFALDATRDKVITRYLKTSDSEIVEATYRSFLPVTDYNALPNLEGIRNAIDEVAQRVPAARGRMPEEFVDLRFLKELEREGFFQAFE